VVADLAEVVAGAPVRRSTKDVTVFKSVGVAFEDLVVARAAVVQRS
jgi:ornithine cyclodeaminase/alanine dehydrogenase-like protein (mu-crystallin family)